MALYYSNRYSHTVRCLKTSQADCKNYTLLIPHAQRSDSENLGWGLGSRICKKQCQWVSTRSTGITFWKHWLLGKIHSLTLHNTFYQLSPIIPLSLPHIAINVLSPSLLILLPPLQTFQCPYHFFTFACAQIALSHCLKGYLFNSSRFISNIPFSVQPEVSYFLCYEWTNDQQPFIKYLLSTKCLNYMQSHLLFPVLEEPFFFSFYRWGKNFGDDKWLFPKLQNC